MTKITTLSYIKDLLVNTPEDWLKLTTHRLDIYNESKAKTEFIDRFESLYAANNFDKAALNELPTAYDYIRLGHPLSSVLEWAIANSCGVQAEAVISFSSKTTPILAVLRKNLMEKRATRIVYNSALPSHFDAELIRKVYQYDFELVKQDKETELPAYEGTTVFVSSGEAIGQFQRGKNIDICISLHDDMGSILLVDDEAHESYISEIQHVRRRETIAMTPLNCFKALHQLVGMPYEEINKPDTAAQKAAILQTIKEITATKGDALLASSGLSIQYAIMMGIVNEAVEKHAGKDIKIIVPPNCYGGTNDQARRVAACIENAEVMDLPVDGENDMVSSIDQVLDIVAQQDAVPYIIVEIPTNPRVEVPDMEELKAVLSRVRKTAEGKDAVDPVFILDQTFCPNIQFLSDDGLLSSIRTISYVSGSKFPSGGKCTAGYCLANTKAAPLMKYIQTNLEFCDNEATAQQVEILSESMPSMVQRIADAYVNTRDFVNYIKEVLPAAKINFVSEELAAQTFTPSVFSLDLPTKGNSPEEREAHKRMLNLRLINLMIGQIPQESKYCVSYGQLKGCYWTIPATSTQGTTKEGDKDYIVRVSVSPDLDLDLHKKIFKDFVDTIDQ